MSSAICCKAGTVPLSISVAALYERRTYPACARASKSKNHFDHEHEKDMRYAPPLTWTPGQPARRGRRMLSELSVGRSAFALPPPLVTAHLPATALAIYFSRSTSLSDRAACPLKLG
jgi:hypothetical protein